MNTTDIRNRQDTVFSCAIFSKLLHNMMRFHCNSLIKRASLMTKWQTQKQTGNQFYHKKQVVLRYEKDKAKK